MSNKYYAFIDSQNLNLGVKSQGWFLDFSKFYVYLKDKFKIERAFLFIGYVEGNQPLYTFLQKVGYICVFKPTLVFTKNKKYKIKGNVDAELAKIIVPNKKYSSLLKNFSNYIVNVGLLKEKLKK